MFIVNSKVESTGEVPSPSSQSCRAVLAFSDAEEEEETEHRYATCQRSAVITVHFLFPRIFKMRHQIDSSPKLEKEESISSSTAENPQ